MAEIIFDPTPEIVESVNNLILPLSDKRSELEALAGRFSNLYRDLETLSLERKTVIDPLLAVTNQAEEGLLQSRISLQEARYRAATTTTDLVLVRHRVLEKLHSSDPSILPFWLRFIRSRTKPAANPLDYLEDDLSAKHLSFMDANTQLELAYKQAEENFDPQIAALKSGLGRAKNNLTGIWEPIAIDDYDLAGNYVVLFESRGEEFSYVYANKHAHDDSWEGYFPSFRKDLERQFPNESKRGGFVEREWIKYVASTALAEWKNKRS